MKWAVVIQKDAGDLVNCKYRTSLTDSTQFFEEIQENKKTKLCKKKHHTKYFQSTRLIEFNI